MRFETTPSFQAQVDWKENFKIINKEGKEFEINIFLMILDYSRYKYIELTLDKTQDTLFECIMHACKSFGGVPHEVKLMDRLKVYNKEFNTIEELDNIVKKLMIEINNEDINFVEKPIYRLKEEQKYLSSLPSINCVSQYFRQNKGYKVSKESMITYKKHKYSVPIKYIGEYITVSENEDTLNIYYTTDLIVSHKISRKIFKL